MGKPLKFKGKKILLISPESWGNIFVSKHHYSKELSKHNLVYFLNPPKSKTSYKEVYTNIFVIDYKPMLRGLGKLPFYVSGFIIKKEIDRLEKLIGQTFDIIWNFDSSRFFNLVLIRDKITIAHLVDLNQNFHRKKLAKTSNVCFCTTDFILSELLKDNARSYKIHHGYHPVEESNLPSPHLPGDHIHKVLYIGNLSMKYIDWQVILETVRTNSNLDFIFVGPDGGSNLGESTSNQRKKLQTFELPNVFKLDPVSYELIPTYLRSADILMVSYLEQYHLDQASPHKFMEYFASGKVIVATYTSEYRNRRDLLVMVDINKDYPNQFTEVANNLPYFNSESFMQRRINFARANSYEFQLEKIERHINEAMGNGSD